jgi:Fe-S cluster assembly protein SufD
MGHGKYIDPFEISPRGPMGLGRDDRGCASLARDDNSVISSVVEKSISAGEVLNLDFVVMPGESRDIDLRIDLIGPGAEVNLRGLYLCSGDERVNFRILVHHRAPGCHSTQLFNGLAGGAAQVSFHGTIVVAPDAQQTEAYQENHNILLSDAARVETLPQLEIYADDVKCSHGATVGRLDEAALFYMRSRGIPEQEARALQALSFLSGVIPAGRENEVEAAVKSLFK